MLNPDSVLLMLLLPSVKHLILAIRMSLQHAVLHFSRSHLVICRLAKCESRLEKPFCNASSEMPEGTGGCGQRGFYWERLCAFLLLWQTFHCPAITFVYKYICKITFSFTGGRGGECLCAFLLLLQPFHCPAINLDTVCSCFTLLQKFTFRSS